MMSEVKGQMYGLLVMTLLWVLYSHFI